jgi:hypothetical protein
VEAIHANAERPTALARPAIMAAARSG